MSVEEERNIYIYIILRLIRIYVCAFVLNSLKGIIDRSQKKSGDHSFHCCVSFTSPTVVWGQLPLTAVVYIALQLVFYMFDSCMFPWISVNTNHWQDHFKLLPKTSHWWQLWLMRVDQLFQVAIRSPCWATSLCGWCANTRNPKMFRKRRKDC